MNLRKSLHDGVQTFWIVFHMWRKQQEIIQSDTLDLIPKRCRISMSFQVQMFVGFSFFILRYLYSLSFFHFASVACSKHHQHAQSLKVNPPENLLLCSHMCSPRPYPEILLGGAGQRNVCSTLTFSLPASSSVHVWKQLYFVLTLYCPWLLQKMH